MCALFGPGVTLHSFPLDGESPAVRGGVLAIPCERQSVALLAPTVHPWVAKDPPVILQTADRRIPVRTAGGISLAMSVLMHPQAIARFGTHAERIENIGLETRIHEAPEDPPPRVHRALEFMRGRPLLRRLVPARILTPAQAERWVSRMSASKRITAALIELLGVVPDIPLVGDAPVHFLREESAIAYHLPDRPVAPSTIVLAKHRKSGELLLGRFAKD